MTHFRNIYFPDSISIVESNSGIEYRNSNWEMPRYRYNVGHGLRSHQKVQDVVALFNLCKGRQHSFSFKDWADYKSCKTGVTPSHNDQWLGSGDGVTRIFPIYKYYSVNGQWGRRRIHHLKENTVTVGMNWIPSSNYPGWIGNIDHVNGYVVFNYPVPAGFPLTLGYEFFVPVRFDHDTLEIQMDDAQLSSVDVQLVEVRLS